MTTPGRDRCGRRARWGAHRVAVLLGRSTSGLLETELGYRRRGPAGEVPPDVRYQERQNVYSVGALVRHAFDLRGPSWVVSTACSSSAKVYASAARPVVLARSRPAAGAPEPKQ